MAKRTSSIDPAISRLIERQMRNWELARSQRPSGQKAPPKAVEDFITVSRLAGAGGKAVAALLGQRLGWPVFDKEILNVMAGDDTLRSRIYAAMDERDITWCEETLRTLLQPNIKNDYFHRLTDTILSLARQSNAVFLGRGADLVLPPRVGLRVHLVGPREQRISRYAHDRGVSNEQAITDVARLDAERAAFLQAHFGPRSTDPARYDMVLNLGRITPEHAADLIVSARGTFSAMN